MQAVAKQSTSDVLGRDWSEVASELTGCLPQQCKECYRIADTVVKLTFVFLCVTFRGSLFFPSSLVITKDADSADSARPIQYSTSERTVACEPAPTPFTLSAPAFSRVPCTSTTRLLCVSNDSQTSYSTSERRVSCAPALTPFIRSAPAISRVPCTSSTCLLCVSNDSQTKSRKTAPSTSLYYSLTHVHRSIGLKCDRHSSAFGTSSCMRSVLQVPNSTSSPTHHAYTLSRSRPTKPSFSVSITAYTTDMPIRTLTYKRQLSFSHTTIAKSYNEEISTWSNPHGLVYMTNVQTI